MKVFFLGYEQADVPCIEPLMRALSASPGWEPVFVPGLDFKEHRGSLALATGPPGVTVRRLEDELGIGELEEARRRGRALHDDALRRAEAVAGGGPFDARVVGASLRELFERSYAPALFEAYAEWELGLHALLRRERPQLVVLPEDTDYLRGRPAARVLAAQGVTVVCLVPFYYNVFASYPLLGERYAARYLVMNRAYADRLEGQGVAAQRVEVVGNPAFDALGEESEPPPAPCHFLYALQDLAWEREILADLMAIFDDVPAASLTVKPHPALPSPAWLSKLHAPSNVRIVAAETGAERWIRSATCVIAQSSAMLYQASILRRAVIVPHYDPAPQSFHLPAHDRARVVARSAAELRERIDAVLAGEGQGFAREEIAPFHPRSTERAVQCLEALRMKLSAGEGSRRPSSRQARATTSSTEIESIHRRQ
jgi:hypothetical protein